MTLSNNRKLNKKCIDCGKQICDTSIRCHSCVQYQRVGENSPNYKHGLGDLRVGSHRRGQDYIVGYAVWKKDVLERDNYTCQHCDSKIKLRAHHIESYVNHLELRIVIENGITLCEVCHNKLHHLFGKDVTAKQLQWFFENVKCIN